MGKSLEVLIFGTGGESEPIFRLIGPLIAKAVGAVTAWRIAQNPAVRVSVVCRSNYEAIKANGIRLRTAFWGPGHFMPARVCRSPREVRDVPFDYIVTANKLTSSPTYSELAGLVNSRTTLVSAQNGIGIEDTLRQAFPSNTLLSAIVYISCAQPKPGIFRQPMAIKPHALGVGLSHSPLGRSEEDISRLREFCSYDEKFAMIEDIVSHRWSKQLWNGAFNTLAAITRCDSHQLLDPSGPYLAMVIGIMHETQRVAAAAGAVMPPDAIERLIELTRRRPPVQPSMLQDVFAGRPLETESLCGNVCRLAERLGINTPIMTSVYRELLALGTGKENQASVTRKPKVESPAAMVQHAAAQVA